MGITSNKNSSFFATYFTLWFLWGVIHYFLLISFQIMPYSALIDSLISNSIISILCIGVYVFFQFYLPTKKNTYYIFLVSLLLVGFWYMIN